MKSKKCISGVFAAVVLLSQAASVGAQDIPGRKEIKRADLGGNTQMEVIESFLDVPPGGEVPYHTHHGIEAMYVIQGATVQLPNGESRTYPTGATQMNLRDIPHGGAKVTGDVAFKAYTVHIVDKGKPLAEPVKK